MTTTSIDTREHWKDGMLWLAFACTMAQAILGAVAGFLILAG